MPPLVVTTLFALTTLLGAQEPAKPEGKPEVAEQAEPAFGGGWANQVPLAGGAGRIYGDRPKALAALDDGYDRVALRAALDWLRHHQAEDGHWPQGPIDPAQRDRNVTLTALGALAMLGSANTLRSGPYQDSLRLAINWLRMQQDEHGAFATSTGPHLIATLAMVEAYTLSSYKLLTKAQQLGLEFAATRRHEDGGWRASAEATDSEPALTAWGTMLLGAEQYLKMQNSGEQFAAASAWLRGPRSSFPASGAALGCEADPARRAELVHDQALANAFARSWIEALSPDDPAIVAALQRDATWHRGKGQRLSMLGWFWTANALHQAGEQDALKQLLAALADAQVQDGDDKGSWQPIGVFGEVGGRAWTTALAALTLETPFRYRRDLPRGLQADGDDR